MIKRDSDLYKQHLQYEIRDYFLPEKIGKHALIWEQYQNDFSGRTQGSRDSDGRPGKRPTKTVNDG